MYYPPPHPPKKTRSHTFSSPLLSLILCLFLYCFEPLLVHPNHLNLSASCPSLPSLSLSFPPLPSFCLLIMLTLTHRSELHCRGITSATSSPIFHSSKCSVPSLNSHPTNTYHHFSYHRTWHSQCVLEWHFHGSIGNALPLMSMMRKLECDSVLITALWMYISLPSQVPSRYPLC